MLWICSVQANMGIARLEAPPFMVRWSQVWYFYPLGGIFSTKFWIRMVLVPLERTATTWIRGIHEKELSTKFWICWLCTNVSSWIFWCGILGRATFKVRSKVLALCNLKDCAIWNSYKIYKLKLVHSGPKFMLAKGVSKLRWPWDWQFFIK